MLQHLNNLLVNGIDFLIRERFFLGAVADPDGNALLSCRDITPLVQVKYLYLAISAALTFLAQLTTASAETSSSTSNAISR